MTHTDTPNHEATELRRELAHERARHQWQPIATAPKDGRILIAQPEAHGWSYYVAEWCEGLWEVECECYDLQNCEPTLWQPITPPAN